MQISISQRIAIGLSLLLVLIAILIASTAVFVSRYRQATLTVVNTLLPNTYTVSHIHNLANSALTESLHYVITGNDEHLQSNIDDARQARTQLAALVKLQNAASLRDKLPIFTLTVENSLTVSNDVVKRRQRGETFDLIDLVKQLDAGHDQIDAQAQIVEDIVQQEAQTSLTAVQGNPLIVPGIIGVLALLLGIGVFVVMVRTIVRPLRLLRAAAIAVAGGDLSQRVPVTSADEIGAVGQAFNTMIARVAGQQQVLQERAASLEAANAAQAQLIATVQALDVPIIPVGAGVLALPLIGAVDAARAATLTERLLNAVYKERAHTVILDVTGVAVADAQLAHYLLAMTQSIALLGAQAILTGISANLSQTLAQMDVDLSQITIKATLRDAIAATLGTH